MKPEKSSSLGKDAWLRLRANRMAMVSLFILVAVGLLSLLGPMLSSHAYDEQNLDRIFENPNSTYLFGTDNLGRDLFARTTYGGRISLSVGLLATFVSLIIGVTYGMISGYAGGRVDAWMMEWSMCFMPCPSLSLSSCSWSCLDETFSYFFWRSGQWNG